MAWCGHAKIEDYENGIFDPTTSIFTFDPNGKQYVYFQKQQKLQNL